MMKRVYLLCALVSGFLFIFRPIYGQTPTASVVGVVEDPTGAVVAGAAVKIRNAGTGEVRDAISNGRGEFTVAQLPPGQYAISIEKAGFRALRETGIDLQVDQVARLKFQLELGSVSESVEVTGQAPLINTENATKGEVITAMEMTEMPLDGRDFSNLAYLVAGVVPVAQGGWGYLFNINGARSDDTNMLVDGFNDQNSRAGDAQVHPNLDALQEFKLQTAGFSAEYGRLAGGVMNMVLKSGSNELHGTAFEFLRNDLFDARNFFDAQKHELRRNQFGATASGPIVIPRLYNGRNRTFFLFSWESYRQVLGTNSLTRVPEAIERTGDFSRTASGAGGQIATLKDPLGGVFPGNQIPASRMSPIALKLLPYYPLANLPGQANNYLVNLPVPSPWDSFIYKIDQRVGSAGNLSVRYTRSYSPQITPFGANSALGTFGTIGQNDRSLAGITYSHVFSPSFINESRIGFTRAADHTHGVHQGTDYNTLLGIPAATTDPKLIGFPGFSITGLAALGDGANQPNITTSNIFQWADTATWVHGQHLIKFGADIIHTQYYQPYTQNVRGTFNFLGNVTSVPFADFLLGLPDSTAHTVSVNDNYMFTTSYGFFAQDDFKISSRLTLNLGVRWDILKPPEEKYGRVSSFVPEVGKIVVGDDSTVPNLNSLAAQLGLTGNIGTAKQYGLPRSLVYTNYTNLAPRFGLAWRPLGGNRMVVRGGYGMYWSNFSEQNSIRIDEEDSLPFAITERYNRQTNNPYAVTLSNPFPAALGSYSAVGGGASGYDAHAPSQYMQSWNLTLEREIGRGLAIEAAYTGSKGTHLVRRFDINQPFYEAALRLPNGTFPRPYPALGSINYYWFGGNSIYNAATFTLRRRFDHGLFYRVNYTYGKSIDSGSQAMGSGAGGYSGAQNSRDIGAERGRSDWDRGHSFTIDGSWELPFHGRFARGWQIAGTGRAYTGSPFTPQVSNVNLNLGQANRPNRIAKGTLANPSANMWFNLSAFPQVPTGAFAFGDSGRNILDGPGMEAINTALYRNLRIGERCSAQVRWEAFNVLNHANLNIPIVYVNQVNSGTITGAGSGRSMQFGLRLRF